MMNNEDDKRTPEDEKAVENSETGKPLAPTEGGDDGKKPSEQPS